MRQLTPFDVVYATVRDSYDGEPLERLTRRVLDGLTEAGFNPAGRSSDDELLITGWSDDDLHLELNTYEKDLAKGWRPSPEQISFRKVVEAEVSRREEMNRLAESGPIEWVTVPRYPTDAMQRASRLTTDMPQGGRVIQWGSNAWAAMLAAAPKPPVPQDSPTPETSDSQIIYQYREIGESQEWKNCSYTSYRTFQSSPHYDTRELVVGIPTDESWQPMETAPRDGTTVRIRLRRGWVRARWRAAGDPQHYPMGWVADTDGSTFHEGWALGWMPLSAENPQAPGQS